MRSDRWQFFPWLSSLSSLSWRQCLFMPQFSSKRSKADQPENEKHREVPRDDLLIYVGA